jgi:hypothetical protein
MRKKGKENKVLKITGKLAYNHPNLGAEVTCSDEDNSVIFGATCNLKNKRPKPYVGFSNRRLGKLEIGYDFNEREGYFSFEPSRLLKIIGYSTPLAILGSLILYSLVLR